MLKETISPGLRSLGFTGSGGRYLLPSETHWARIGFQKSAYGPEQQVRFTFNISVVSKADWQRIRANYDKLANLEKPSPTVGHGPRGTFHWERIGLLMPEQRDLWWNVDSTTDTHALGRVVISHVEAFALPAILAIVNG